MGNSFPILLKPVFTYIIEINNTINQFYEGSKPDPFFISFLIEPFANSSFFEQILICTPNWQWTTWSQCVNNSQSQSATDLNHCDVNNDFQLATRVCEPS